MRPQTALHLHRFLHRCLQIASVVCGSLSLLAACQAVTTPSTSVAARLEADKTNEACIAQMQKAVESQKAGQVILTRAAFATNDRLSIVPADPIGADGLPASGRIRGGPEHYRLSIRYAGASERTSGQCVMTRERDGQTTELSACTCVPMLKS